MTTKTNDKILSIDLSLDSICPVITTYEDSHKLYRESIIDYDYLDVLDYSYSPIKASAIIISNVINTFIKDPTISLGDLCALFNKYYFSMFDNQSKEHIAVSAKSFTRLTQIYNYIVELFNKYTDIAPDITYYTPIGTMPRYSYASRISAILLSESTVDLFIITKQDSSVALNALINPKVLSAIDYCAEAGVHIKNVNILSYSFDNIGIPIVIRRHSVTEHVLKAVKSFMSMGIRNSPNISYCMLCHYNSSCVNIKQYSTKITDL